MKRTRRVNVDLGCANGSRGGVVLTTHWRTGKGRVEYNINSDSPFALAWLAKAAIESLEARKADIETALRIARGQ